MFLSSESSNKYVLPVVAGLSALFIGYHCTKSAPPNIETTLSDEED